MRKFAAGIWLANAALAVTLMVGPGVAQATDERPKDSVCHPVEGNGETGNGWNIIEPDKASSHIDEETGEGKHTRKDGRTDVYVDENGLCPGEGEEQPVICSDLVENADFPDRVVSEGEDPSVVCFKDEEEPEPKTICIDGEFIEVPADDPRTSDGSCKDKPPVDEPPVDEPPVDKPEPPKKVNRPDILPVTGPVQDALMLGGIALLLAGMGTAALLYARKQRAL